jgi:hypothetical protein
MQRPAETNMRPIRTTNDFVSHSEMREIDKYKETIMTGAIVSIHPIRFDIAASRVVRILNIPWTLLMLRMTSEFLGKYVRCTLHHLPNSLPSII